MRTWWQFLAAWWSDDATGANYPASPGGQVPTLQADGTVQWSDVVPAAELLVEDGAMELLFDDDTGDVLYEG